MAVFDRGDIVSVPLDHAVGHAQRGAPGSGADHEGVQQARRRAGAPITQGGDLRATRGSGYR